MPSDGNPYEAVARHQVFRRDPHRSEPQRAVPNLIRVPVEGITALSPLTAAQATHGCGGNTCDRLGCSPPLRHIAFDEPLMPQPDTDRSEIGGACALVRVA